MSLLISLAAIVFFTFSNGAFPLKVKLKYWLIHVVQMVPHVALTCTMVTLTFSLKIPSRGLIQISFISTLWLMNSRSASVMTIQDR